jgi:acyl-CoA reductase-like NAD-dependent aldehyde dehydrogenase
MNKFADLIDANTEDIAKVESEAMGQPMTLAAGMIVPAAASCWR